MGYRERKARFESGGMTVGDVIGLGIASAVGIVAAAFLDLTQAAEASSLFVINKWVSAFTTLIGVGNLPLYGVLLLLMAIGGFAIVFFQPVTLRGAFVQGFGLLAVLTTVAPSDLGQSLPGLPSAAPAELSMNSTNPLAQQVSMRTNAAAVINETQPGYTIRMQIELPNGLAKDRSLSSLVDDGSVRGKLYDETTGATYNLFRNSGATVEADGKTIRIATRLPGTAPETSLVARIESKGYRIVESRFAANNGLNQPWVIKMQPSSTPLLIQRLRRPYWF